MCLYGCLFGCLPIVLYGIMKRYLVEYGKMVVKTKYDKTSMKDNPTKTVYLTT